MAKLHELLAVGGNLNGQAEKVRTDLAGTFEKKRHLFTKKVVTFFSKEEGVEPVREEQLDLQSTVRKELAWVAGIWTQALDVSAQIAETNTVARADVVLDSGKTLFTSLPATALLELEKRLGEIQTLLQAVPTLDPAKGFATDATEEQGVYQAREINKPRTKKIQRPLELSPATKEHPAQVQLITEDVVVGNIKEQEWSGLITPAEKADMLERTEQVRRAVKAARSRANEAPVSSIKVGEMLFDYVLGGKVS